MQLLLSDERSGVLEAFRRPGTLVALDYDGTLAPIVANRYKAVMRERTYGLLQQVAQRYPTVVITGRSREDAARFVEGVGLRALIGNHGLDLQPGRRKDFRGRVQEWREELAERLELCKGVLIEDKRLSLSLHYRNAPDKAGTEALLWRVAGQLEDARLVGGKDVINVVPAEGTNKADALLDACRRFGCERAIFVGDDETDEDVFALQAQPVLGIHVGLEADSRAAYRLRDQHEIDDLLLALVAERPAIQ